MGENELLQKLSDIMDKKLNPIQENLWKLEKKVESIDMKMAEMQVQIDNTRLDLETSCRKQNKRSFMLLFYVANCILLIL